MPAQPVVVGNAFQVQYILTSPAGFQQIAAPVSGKLQLVSGPNQYKGEMMVNGQLQPILNITFTFIATAAGKITLPRTTASYHDRQVSAPGAMITAIPPPKASYNAQSSYTDAALYAPASAVDLEKLVKENLFVRAEADRTTTYPGEPVVATFTLFSRLQSTSEVVNAPSLYGFSVTDMLNTNEAHLSVETIDNKIYNTSVLRKLQLYPEQPGRLIIDPMELFHEIEFDDSLAKDGKKIFRHRAGTEPIAITVKPLPSNKPQNYTGAVGQFRIELLPQQLPQHAAQQGAVAIRVSGQGNFLQLAAPQINWPKGLEVLDPVINEALNKTLVPLTGNVDFVYTIIPQAAGNYTIPPVSLSFFDPRTGQYQKVSSDSIAFQVGPPLQPQKNQVTENAEEPYSGWLPVIAFAALAVLVLFLFRKKKQPPTEPVETIKAPSYSELIESIDRGSDPKAVCLQLEKILWSARQEATALSNTDHAEYNAIRADCQLMAYAATAGKEDVELLTDRALVWVRRIEANTPQR